MHPTVPLSAYCSLTVPLVGCLCQAGQGAEVPAGVRPRAGAEWGKAVRAAGALLDKLRYQYTNYTEVAMAGVTNLLAGLVRDTCEWLLTPPKVKALTENK